jgi:general stress protein YciG
MTDATPVYRAIILECERRRVALGMSMEKFSEFAGLPDRYYAKALRVDEPSGRQASWSTLQIIVDCLFPDGFDVQLKPKIGGQLDALSLMFKTRYEQALGNGKTRREHMAEIGRKGGAARKANLSQEERSRIAQTAGFFSGLARRTKRAKLRAKNAAPNGSTNSG